MTSRIIAAILLGLFLYPAPLYAQFGDFLKNATEGALKDAGKAAALEVAGRAAEDAFRKAGVASPPLWRAAFLAALQGDEEGTKSKLMDAAMAEPALDRIRPDLEISWVGQTVAAETKDGARVKGKLAGVNGLTIVVTKRDGSMWSRSLDQVAKIWRKQ
jgi:hypothetical protein